MGFKYQKSLEELQEALVRQVCQLRRSMAGYDEGHIDEAERLASTLYTLFLDGKTKSNSRSITQLLGIKERLAFPDSSFPPPSDPDEIRVGPPLCMVGTDDRYLPRGDGELGAYPMLSFDAWWNQVVYRTRKSLELTRKWMIIRLRHQDGGGHVDRFLTDEAYHWLRTKGDIYLSQSDVAQFTIHIDPNWQKPGRGLRVLTHAYFEAGEAKITTSNNPPPKDAKPLKGAHWASIRQIATEANYALIHAGL